MHDLGSRPSPASRSQMVRESLAVSIAWYDCDYHYGLAFDATERTPTVTEIDARPPLLSDTFLPHAAPVSRRGILGGAGLGAAGLAVASLLPQQASAAVPPGFDSMDPETNLRTLLKIQADLSGADTINGFGGKAWMWVPGEANYLAFQTYGIGATRLDYQGDGVWNFHHREVLYYLDPKTGEILDTWTNPVTGRTVEVLHILNDPVNRISRVKGGFIQPPFAHDIVGDRIVFQIDVFRTKENPISRKEYPLHSQQDVYQSCELWAISSNLSEVADPDVTSASNHTAWARCGMWLPFMEMGNRAGHMVYHSQSFKFMNGIDGLPKHIRDYTAKHHPQYLEAPKEWKGLRENENTWSYAKKIIDERRAAGRGGPGGKGSVFGVPDAGM
jgi:hypothetical protein